MSCDMAGTQELASSGDIYKMKAIVYIQIKDDLPRCIWSSIKKARELFSGKIYVVAPAREMDYPQFKEYNITLIKVESLQDEILNEYGKHTLFNYDGWNGFWDNACKRFLYIYLLQKKYGIDELIQMETDVVPYMNINNMFDIFKTIYSKKLVFVPYGTYQHNCSFMYCDDVNILGCFCREIINYFKTGLEHFRKLYPGQSLVNETHFAYTFAQNNSSVDLFPAMPGDKHFDELGFLIDPHGWGMWLGGRQRIPGIQCAVHTQHIGVKIIEGVYDIHFSYKDGRIKQPYVYDVLTLKSYPLATLHFNSKRPEQWI